MDKNLKTALKVSIVITTKNRKEELCNAIDSCLNLTGENEIFIFDDGSTDNTYEYVVEKYPGVLIHREEQSIGLINARSKAATLVSGDIIFSIDDDAVFSDKNIIADCIKDFEVANIGAIAIPLINIKYSNDIIQLALDNENCYVISQYIGTAHAIRKDIFLKLGAYRSYFVRQCEEMDFCLRMLDAGFYVKLGYSKPIIHYESPKRDVSIIKFYNARNNIIFSFLNVPLLFLLIHIIFNITNLLLNSNKYHYYVIKGILSGFNQIIVNKEIKRAPVKIRTYLLYRKLRKESVKINENIHRL